MPVRSSLIGLRAAAVSIEELGCSLTGHESQLVMIAKCRPQRPIAAQEKRLGLGRFAEAWQSASPKAL